jgi:hypothetical protein
MQPLICSLGAIEHSTQVFMLHRHRVYVSVMFTPLYWNHVKNRGDFRPGSLVQYSLRLASSS